MDTTAKDSAAGRMSWDVYRRWVEAAQPSGRFERIDWHVVATAPERASYADRKARWFGWHGAGRLPVSIYYGDDTAGPAGHRDNGGGDLRGAGFGITIFH